MAIQFARCAYISRSTGRNACRKASYNQRALNLGVRDILRGQGKLGDVELACMTSRGKAAFAVRDRIQLTKTDKDQGFINGRFGMIERIDETAKIMAVCFDNGETKEIDRTYDGLHHGYASTVYKAQEATLSISIPIGNEKEYEARKILSIKGE